MLWLLFSKKCMNMKADMKNKSILPQCIETNFLHLPGLLFNTIMQMSSCGIF